MKFPPTHPTHTSKYIIINIYFTNTSSFTLLYLPLTIKNKILGGIQKIIGKIAATCKIFETTYKRTKFQVFYFVKLFGCYREFNYTFICTSYIIPRYCMVNEIHSGVVSLYLPYMMYLYIFEHISASHNYMEIVFFLTHSLLQQYLLNFQISEIFEVLYISKV